MSDDTTAFLDAMTRQEPLHPELERYHHTTAGGFDMVRHPLVYGPASTPAFLNRQFAQKVDAAARAFAEAKWHSYVWLHERPWRRHAFLRVAPHLGDREYWEFARDVWVDSENVWEGQAAWLDIFASERPKRKHFMTQEERADLHRMPGTLTVYRGCLQDLNDDGLAWTLDRDRAEWFARRCAIMPMFDHDEHPAVVLVGEVKKDAIMGYIGRARGEEEVVARTLMDVRVTSVFEL